MAVTIKEQADQVRKLISEEVKKDSEKARPAIILMVLVDLFEGVFQDIHTIAESSQRIANTLEEMNK